MRLHAHVHGSAGRRVSETTFHITLESDGKVGLRASVREDGVEIVRSAPLETAWMAKPPAGLGEGAPTSPELFAQLDAGTASSEALRLFGEKLYHASIGALRIRPDASLEARVRELRQAGTTIHFRLEIPSDLTFEPSDEHGPMRASLVPWEAMRDRRMPVFWLAGHPTSSIARCLANDEADVRPAATRAIDAPRVVIAIPERSGLDTTSELAGVRNVLKQAGARDDRVIALTKAVTREAIAEALSAKGKRPAADVLHFIGHGSRDDRGEVRLHLNDAAGNPDPVPADVLAQSLARTGVQLVVLSCCLAGAPSTDTGALGLGPMLLTVNVPAVVAMRYGVTDGQANAFATQLYTSLFLGDSKGRVDVAVQAARAALAAEHERAQSRSACTPILFLARGAERLFDVSGSASIQGVSDDRRAPAEDAPALPDDLVQAVREQRCVPMLGAGLLESERDAPSSLTLRGLATKLAETLKLPEADREELERAPKSTDIFLFQRVCQFFLQQKTPPGRKPTRVPLTSAVAKAYESATTPAWLADLAAWRPPAVVCTHFDGFASQVLSATHASTTGVTTEDLPAVLTRPLVVNVRGTVKVTKSLVLTEEEHDRLWDAIQDLNGLVEELVQTDARSLLCIGVSPRDPWVKHLVRKLAPDQGENVGPIFFASDGLTDVDRACWTASFPTTVWVPGKPWQIVSALTAAIAQGAD